MPRAAFSRARKPFLVLLAAGIVVGASWWAGAPRDPSARGERLSQYVVDIPKDAGTKLPSTEQLEAFGPAGITWLTYMLENGRHPFHKHGRLPLDTAPDWLRRWLPESWGGIRVLAFMDERVRAASLLSQLGPQAASAIPMLLRNLENEDVSQSAAYTLQAIGPAAWPTVQNSLDHGSPHARAALLMTMYVHLHVQGQEVSEVVASTILDAIIKAMHDPDWGVRFEAANAVMNYLANRKNDARIDSAIPPLIELLSDRISPVVFQAASSLSLFEAKAAPAIPRFIELLDHSDPFVRSTVAGFLPSIDQTEKRSAVRLRAMLRDDPVANCRQAAADALKALGLSLDAGVGQEIVPAQ
jgi:hypothetical protein